MNTVLLGLYLIMSVLHLIGSYRDDPVLRRRTKPFLLILLLLFYLVSTSRPNVLLILALLTSWLGDVLLIPKGHNWFTYGGISFMFSHLFFVLVYLRQISFSSVPLALVLVLMVIYYGIALAVIYALKDTTPKKMVIPMYFYLLCNSTMNIFAFMQMVSTHTPGSIVAYIGAVLFFISDCTLFLVRYYRRPEIVYKKHFTVMLTYLLGELLIVIGILMIQG